MKAIAIDTSISKITISVKNEDKTASTILNIGMKQSESLVPAMDEMMKTAGLLPDDLECAVISKGPGSFTGLRLGFAAVKALESAFKIPVYGVDSLLPYAKAFETSPVPVLSVIDAKKEKFYAALYNGGKISVNSGDYTKEEIFDFIKAFDSIVVTGPDALLFQKLISEAGLKTKTFALHGSFDISESLFEIAGQMIEDGTSPLKPFDGPEYLRDSDAKIAQ